MSKNICSVLVAGVVLGTCAPLAAASSRPGGVAVDQWRTWWGQTSISKRGVFELESQAPASPGETHSALLTSAGTWGDQAFSFQATTLAQLRTGSAPNPWEVAWAMFRFRDLQHYYYFILKPNGIELGKKQGSDAQVFLATAGLPTLAIGTRYRVQIRALGPRIEVFVEGTRVLDFTDPDPLPAGSVGLYEEDSHVRFESVSVAAL